MEKNWKKLLTTTNPIRAEIIKQMLEEHHIHAVVLNKQISPYNLGAVEVYVHEMQEGESLRLLNENLGEDEQ